MKRILARHNPGMDTRTSLPASRPGLEPAIRVSMLPRDTNSHGTIFGGVLLAYIDQAGAIATRPYCDLVVTVKMNEVVFHAPVYVGDIVSFYTTVARIGRTSITIKVLVTAERWRKTAADPDHPHRRYAVVSTPGAGTAFAVRFSKGTKWRSEAPR